MMGLLSLLLLLSPRVVAVGDVHGDVEAARRALTLAGALDASGHWGGGDLTVVQTGDLLDRGPREREVVDLFLALKAEAPKHGGRLILLNGNHEIMNVQGDFRYITGQGFSAFADVPRSPAVEARLDAMKVPERARGRVGAFLPGGHYARQFADHPVAVVVHGTAFAHGGVMPAHAAELPAIHRDLSAWMRGEGPPPSILVNGESPWWSRAYSRAAGPDCAALGVALKALGARRMVVGHTPQLGGVTSACEGRVWRVDTGMSAHYGGPTQVLEIQGEKVRVLSAPR
jgi:hypothetical protein